MAKGDKNVSTGNRPTMGTSVGQTVNARQPIKGRSVPRTGNRKGGMLEAATQAHRAGIQEKDGAQLRPTAKLYEANAAEAGLLQRNTVLVPSALGNRDFYTRRQFGQTS